MSKTKYQCTGSSRISWLKPPEGVKVTCEATSSIVSPGTKCTVECDSGSPNYKNLQCKNVGWRPTKEVACEGVNPGVIIGVLIGGLVAVMILAYIYAKYKDKQKKKLGISTKVQTGKISQNGRRPGMPQGGAHEGTGSRSSSNTQSFGIQHQESHSSSGRQSKGSNRTAPPSYHETDSLHDDIALSTQLSSGGRPPPPLPHSDRRGRGYSSKMPPPLQQGYDSGYTGYYDETQEPPSLPQVGYSNSGYYEHSQPQVGYGYGAPEPAISYSAYAHPQSYPSSRDYPKPYHVST